MSSKLKILYIHGLESGPRGTKVGMLKSDFDVYAPDMHMSVLKCSRKNSFLRKALYQHSLPFIISIIILSFAIAGDGYYTYILYGIFGLYVLILIIFRNRFKGFIVSSSLNGCLKIQKLAIDEYKPDLIVSSSWGGAIAFEILKQNIWNGPMILICPAFLNVKSICYGKRIHYSNLALLENNNNEQSRFIKDMLTISTKCNADDKKWIIYHGCNDQTVNIKDSKWIVSCNPDKFELFQIEDENHRMNKWVGSNKLNEAVKQYMNLN